MTALKAASLLCNAGADDALEALLRELNQRPARDWAWLSLRAARYELQTGGLPARVVVHRRCGADIGNEELGVGISAREIAKGALLTFRCQDGQIKRQTCLMRPTLAGRATYVS